MKIAVIAKPHARIEKVELMAKSDTPHKSDVYTVSIKALAVDGKANTAIIAALARHFDVAPSRITCVLGQTGKQKLFEIL